MSVSQKYFIIKYLKNELYVVIIYVIINNEPRWWHGSSMQWPLQIQNVATLYYFVAYCNSYGMWTI